MGNTGLPCATGCPVKYHSCVPGPEPAYWPARPRGCAQSAKWIWICGSGSSSVTVPCSHNAPALPAENVPGVLESDHWNLAVNLLEAPEYRRGGRAG